MSIRAVGLGLSCYILLILSIFCQALVASEFPSEPYRELIQMEKDPFWRKPKYFKRLENDRAIMVSVTTDKIKDTDQQSLKMQGAGIVSRPLSTAYSTLKDLSRWKEMSEYIKRSDYDPDTKTLDLHLVAFDYHARINFKIFFDEAQEDLKAIRFLVLDGAFKDMKGLLEFKDHERRNTEISMTVLDEFDKLPLPTFFIEFGLEVVFQKMAGRMRSFIESNSPTEKPNDKAFEKNPVNKGHL